jgi:Predicted membrane protein (DUF2157)/Domain of unknown function (DUF4401)
MTNSANATPSPSLLSSSITSASKWPPKANHLLAVSGASALVLGLIFIIAFNWAGLGKFAKFGLVQVLIIALTGGAIVRGLSTAAGKGMLVMALGCIGPLLAVFGQTYQTGADVWQLFAGWAALGLLWAIAARSGAGWLVWVMIAQAALWLHLDAFYDLGTLVVGSVPLWALILIVNGGLLLIWEGAATRISWLSGRLAPRLIGAILLFSMTSAAIHAMFWDQRSSHLHPFIGWAVLMLIGYSWYARGRRDIVMVTLGWVALAAVALALVIKLLLKIDLIFTVFICFLLALGVLGLGISWLRRNFAGTNHWIVDIAAAFGAWISMLLLILLVGLTVGGLLADSPPFWWVMAALAAVAAVVLAKTSSREQVFRYQLVNVLALAAPTLAYIGVSVNRGGDHYLRGLMAVYVASGVALILWLFLPSKQARSLMAIAVIYGMVALFEHLGLGPLTVWVLLASACALWLLAPNSFITEPQAIERAANDVKIHRLTEFGYAASLWALLIGAGLRSHDRWGLWYVFWRSRDGAHLPPHWAQIPWLPSALAFLIAVVVAAALIRFLGVQLVQLRRAHAPDLLATSRWFADPLVLTLGLCVAALSAWYTPYLLVCATLFAIGVCTERLKLTALATLGIVAALLEFYFEQATPLWMKGTVLALLGVGLLAMAWRASEFTRSQQGPGQGFKS